MKPAILVAGGSHADIPMILAAKKMGYSVITTGNRPTDLGHAYGDKYVQADFSDPEAILKIASDEKVVGICPSCNDFSGLSSAYAAEKLGLPGHDAYQKALIIHHKDRYRQFAFENDIPAPGYASCSSEEEALEAIRRLRLPLIVKPVDLTGGKGMSKIFSEKDLIPAVKKAFSITRQKSVVVEEYLEGSRHGLSLLISDKKPVFWFADDEYYYLNQYLVSAASTPTSVPEEAIQDLLKQSEKICEVMDLCDGIFHVQFIYTNNKPVIIEICRRPPGDLYVDLVSISTRTDYAENIVRFYLGEKCSDIKYALPDGHYLRHCVMNDRKGEIKNIKFSDEVQDKIVSTMMWWKPGDRVEDIMTHKHGIVFMKFKSRAEMKELSSKMQKLIYPVFEGE